MNWAGRPTGVEVRIEDDCGPLEPGGDLREQLKPFAWKSGFEDAEAGEVSIRAVEPRDEADGSATLAKTIGIVRVSRWRAAVAAVVPVTMMSGCKPTNSCASARARLLSSPYHRTTIRTSRPSVQPKSASA